jgi:HK97 family phage prohead protease
MPLQLRNVPFEVKTVTEDGTFSGIASPYGNKDLGEDIVDAGAFTKTIAERGNKVRLLDGHKIRIGLAEVSDGAAGLSMNGIINLDKQAGRDAYSDLKFYNAKGMPMGLSIGYDPIKAEYSPLTKARHLKEVKLYEVSVTEFPMNESARVLSVKSAAGLLDNIKARFEQKADFDTELAELQLQDAAYQMWMALRNSLMPIPWSDVSREEKIAASEQSIQQFMNAYLTFIPGYLDWLDQAYGMKAGAQHRERKEGRSISGGNMQILKTAHSHLTSAAELILPLCTDEAGAKAATTSEHKAGRESEPEILHSAAKTLDLLRSLVPRA